MKVKMLVLLNRIIVIIFIIFSNLSAYSEEVNVKYKKNDWSFDGIFGTFNRTSLQRGYQVYNEVCSGCHSIQHLSYRNLSETGGPEFTFEEAKGEIAGKTISWIGDGNNNMSNSLIEAAGKFNFKLKIGCPKKYEPNKKIIVWAKKNKVDLKIFNDPKKAVTNADCIMTDKWVSMGDKGNKNKKKKLLKSYQVNKKIMRSAKADAIFMHCLPASKGEEVTDEVMDGKQSVVWLEALNRVHAQKSIIEWCLK